MSSINYRKDRLNCQQARKQIAIIMLEHPSKVHFTRHALEEMGFDKVTTVDVLNILKSSSSKIYDQGELEKGSYRYRLETNNYIIVIAFQPDGKTLVVVTAWDKRKGGQ